MGGVVAAITGAVVGLAGGGILIVGHRRVLSSQPEAQLAIVPMGVQGTF